MLMDDSGFETESLCEVKIGQPLTAIINVDMLIKIYGEYRCGKTQICHTMSVIAQVSTTSSENFKT